MSKETNEKEALLPTKRIFLQPILL